MDRRRTAADGAVGISLRDIGKSYGDVLAVEQLTLSVQRGEIFGLIGPDGAGKTTAMRIACGLVRPDRGEAKLMGYDSVLQARKVKEHLGYMPQRFSLYPDLSVAENLRFFADLFGLSRAEREEREADLFSFNRLQPFRERRAGALSGGMKQKLALSCTLIHRPAVLILDEPTTGVDPVSRKEFWSILTDLAAAGLALWVSTPYMDEAALCQRVALMHRGRLIAQGTPEEVITRFPQRILEARGRDVFHVTERMKAEGPAGAQAHRFGDRVHILHDTSEQEMSIRELLASLDISLRVATPTMEDVFVSLVGPGAGGSS